MAKRGRQKRVQQRVRKRVWQQEKVERSIKLGALKIVAWVTVSIIAIVVPSYVLYRMDEPAGEEMTIDQQLSRLRSSDHSFGFDQKDISKSITLLDEEAMSVRWRKYPDGPLVTTFSLGPYQIEDMATKAQLVVMVPKAARMVDCSYMDLSPNQFVEGADPEPVGMRSARCALTRSETAQFYSTPLVPDRGKPGIYHIIIDFEWHESMSTNLGVGRDVLRLQYQGGLVVDSVRDFTPADDVKVLYAPSTSGQQSEASAVFLKYMTHPSENITESAPDPEFSQNRTKTWVSTADRPSYQLSIFTEDPGARRIFEFAGQGIFLVVGAVIGAFVPRMRLRAKNGGK